VQSLSEKVRALFDNVVLTREDMHDYQNEGVQFLLDNPFSALFIDLGLGKTVISLTTILELVGKFDLDNALVVAPLKVAHNTWPDEIKIWSHLTGIRAKQIRTKELVDEVNRRVAVVREFEVMARWDDLTIEDEFEILPKVRAKIALTKNPNKEKITAQITRAQVIKRFKKDIEDACDREHLLASRELLKKEFDANRATVHIINREQVEWLVKAWGRKFPYKNIFIDESDCIKDHTTRRFKALNTVRPMLDRMHQLTATPTAESYKHIFAQIYLLDQGARFGKSYTRFLHEYFEVNQYTRTEKLRPGAADKITEKISDITLTMKSEDYLKMTNCTAVMDTVHLPPDVLKQYREFEKNSVLQLVSGTEIEAEGAASLCQKLLQMASGFVYETKLEANGNDVIETRITHRLHDEKFKKLHELRAKYPDENLLVAYWHNSSLERLKEEFPDAVKMSRKGVEIEAWNFSAIPMLLVHPQSSGHGLNLQKGGRRIVFFDIPWSLGLYLQLRGRLNRQGQVDDVFIHHIVAAGTYDELVVECLTEKKDLQDLFFRLLKKYSKKVVDNREMAEA
jgi:SNF2 family DNA or RNA helicase